MDANRGYYYGKMNKQSRNFKYRNDLLKNPTPSELIFKQRLDELGVRYLFQKGFIKGDYHCIVDFYLPRPHRICFEIDGGIHNTEEQKKRDFQKDSYLKERGFSVVRIKNEDINSFDIKSLLF